MWRTSYAGPNPRDVGNDLFFPLSSEEGFEVAALAIALEGLVEGMVVEVAVAEITVEAAVGLDAVVVAAQFSSAFCVLWIWA